MKRMMFVFTLALISVTVFCQSGFQDALLALGLNPTIATVVSVILLTVIGQFIPQKWAAPLVWAEKLFYAIYLGLHGLNEQTNNLSKSQKAVKAKLAKKAAGIIVMLLMVGAVNAQGPFNGFLLHKKDAVNLVKARADEAGSTKPVLLFRLTANMIATAYDFYEKPVQIKACEAAGLGLSLGKYDENSYCKLAVNGLFLTSVKLNDIGNANFGAGVTVGLFNNVLQFGLGYLDKKFMPLVNVGVTF